MIQEGRVCVRIELVYAQCTGIPFSGGVLFPAPRGGNVPWGDTCVFGVPRCIGMYAKREGLSHVYAQCVNHVLLAGAARRGEAKTTPNP